ncbi:cytochrome c oxidase subunit II [Rhodopila sp.]|jgi:cytochrome c oxidase subunit 2|uniref:cytochrome c oxidase subunit II n=1 Tax=Rhodopila sp. TaxID=2480087 RepID=UPI002CE404E5|nr:cytochrome c oxidase subunit II [Rhodopila sp.]HVZ07500.1 cytochrome c oxidase subunit II [Rhodopila sp.]
MSSARHRFPYAIVTPLLLAACSGAQSAFTPGSPQSQALRSLFWLMTIVCGVIWLLVMLSLILAIWRRGPAALAGSPQERRATMVVGTCVMATVAVIAALTVVSYAATRRMAEAGAEEPLTIRVRASQWWWEVEYPDTIASHGFITANEIHVPVGRPVRVELEAADVIHSFWVPGIAGKLDTIPGRTNTLTFTARHIGVYRGQCAEFCGLQHAHMALLLVVQDPRGFARWEDVQRTQAVTPSDTEQMRGREVLVSRQCAACHTVRGTMASGRLGPDLTHIGGRAFLAAGLLPVTRGSLAAWVADPQTLKPGNNMPLVPLSPDDLRAVSAYLAALR